VSDFHVHEKLEECDSGRLRPWPTYIKRRQLSKLKMLRVYGKKFPSNRSGETNYNRPKCPPLAQGDSQEWDAGKSVLTMRLGELTTCPTTFIKN